MLLHVELYCVPPSRRSLPVSTLRAADQDVPEAQVDTQADACMVRLSALNLVWTCQTFSQRGYQCTTDVRTGSHEQWTAVDCSGLDV